MVTWRDLAFGYLRYLESPWLYLVLAAFVLLQYQRVQSVERSAFGVKVTRPVADWGVSLAFGLLSGLVATTLLALLHAKIGLPDVAFLWIVTVVLGLFNVRLTCLSYSAGALAVLQWVAVLVVQGGAHLGVLGPILQVHVGSLILLAAVLHVVEGVLVYFFGARNASPLFVQSPRGQIVGAFLLQKFWLVPTVLAIAPGLALPFPVLIGYSALTSSAVPRQSARASGFLTAVYGVVMLLLTALMLHFNRYFAIVGVLLIVLHEALGIWLKVMDEHAPALFVRPARGVKVLATLPASPAEKMGLMPGETIFRIGGMGVNSPYDVHFAIDRNPAYVKMEVAGLDGEMRFVGSPLYASDPHQLGVIVVPDERAREFAQIYRMSVRKWLGRWIGSKRRFVAEQTTNIS